MIRQLFVVSVLCGRSVQVARGTVVYKCVKSTQDQAESSPWVNVMLRNNTLRDVGGLIMLNL